MNPEARIRFRLIKPQQHSKTQGTVKALGEEVNELRRMLRLRDQQLVARDAEIRRLKRRGAW